jgi:hypothetical protein
MFRPLWRRLQLGAQNHDCCMNRQCDIGEQAPKAVANSEPSYRRFFESFHVASRHIKPARRTAKGIRSTDTRSNKARLPGLTVCVGGRKRAGDAPQIGRGWRLWRLIVVLGYVEWPQRTVPFWGHKGGCRHPAKGVPATGGKSFPRSGRQIATQTVGLF